MPAYHLIIALLVASAAFVCAHGAVAQTNDDYLVELAEREYFVGGDTPLVDAGQALRPFTAAGGVGIILHYAPWDDGYTVEQIADAYIRAFIDNDIEADFRVVLSDTPGVAVFYIVNDVAQGPYSPNTAFEMITDIARQNRFAHGQ